MSDARATPGAASMTPVWRALAWTIALTLAALLVDHWAYDHLHDPKVYDRDWGRLLRVIGFLGTWAALAIAIALQEGGDAARRALAKRRAHLAFWSPALGGALAEVLKLVFRRERPMTNDGSYGFRPFTEQPFNNAGLALPSSHALVAFAGAAMLARLYPRARWVGYVLAGGCAVSRVMARAHFVSDVVLAAGLGWIVAYLLDRRWPVRDDAASP